VREIARKDFQFSPSSENDICCKTAVASERLDQESELSQQLRKAYPRRELIILNYKEKLWTSMEGGNEEAERNAFWDIMDAIDNMWRDQNLLLQGYPMLTQFNVGIVYMLCHLFDEVSGHCLQSVSLFWCGNLALFSHCTAFVVWQVGIVCVLCFWFDVVSWHCIQAGPVFLM
jgi:hypothetical protein